MMFSLRQEDPGKCFVYGKDLLGSPVYQDLQAVLHRDGCGEIPVLIRGSGAGQNRVRMPDVCAAVSMVLRENDRREAFFIQQILVIEIPLDIADLIFPF